MAVQWNEWASEAFERARREDKLVLLSLVAPWSALCDQMDRTTFADATIADELHREYVPVRVNADARPDIHERYHVGVLPSTVWLTPEGEIIWASSYIPPDDMKMMLEQFRTNFRKNRAQIYESIKYREERVAKIDRLMTTGRSTLSRKIVSETVDGILRTFDQAHGGFGAEAKFPHAASLELLLSVYWESGDASVRRVLEKTLDAICSWLLDPVEGGFFRYAADPLWRTPQTEKLLGDNAALVTLLLDAAAVMGKPTYRESALKSLQWILKTLADPSGAFRNSQKADAFYYLDPKRANPPPVDAAVYCDSNARTVEALLKAWAATGDERYRTAASKCLKALAPRNLLRDHVALLRARLAWFEATGEHKPDPREILTRFSFEGGLGDRVVAPEDVGLLKTPRKEIVESAQFVEALHRLGEPAEEILTGFPDYSGQYGHFTATYALAADRLTRPAVEITTPPEFRREAFAVYAARKILRSGKKLTVNGKPIVPKALADEVKKAVS